MHRRFQAIPSFIAVAGILCTIFVVSPATAAAHVRFEVRNASGHRGDYVTVEVRTKNAVVLGSTDLMLRYDPRVLDAVSADSTTLSGFTYGIDRRRRVVRTASASATGERLEKGDVLFRVTFRVRNDARRRVSRLKLRDGDRKRPRDVAGPPSRGRLPESIRFSAHSGRFQLLDPMR